MSNSSTNPVENRVVKAALDTKYQKPLTGISDEDLDSTILASLDKAESAYQKPSGGIPKTDLASAVQTSLGKADTALQTAPVSSVDGKTGAVSILPSGGTTGQVLKKTSNASYAVAWANEDTIAPSSSAPANIGETAIGTATSFARADHVHDISSDLKVALLNLFEKVAYIDTHGSEYYDELYCVLYHKTLSSITATFTQGSYSVYENDTLDSLKQPGLLAVKAIYSDGSEKDLPPAFYTLSGSFMVGISTVTVSFRNKTTSFTVVVETTPLFDWDFKNSFTDRMQNVEFTVPTNYSAPTIGTNGAEFASSTNGDVFYSIYAPDVIAADRSIVIDVASEALNNGSSRNNRFITTVVTASKGADTGFAYRQNNNYSPKSWGFYNRTNTTWTMTSPAIESGTYLSGKTFGIYIDSSNKWTIYIDGTLLMSITSAVNSNGELHIGSGTLLDGADSYSANAVMTISRVRVYEGNIFA